MKRLIYSLLGTLLLGLTACSEAPYMEFHDIERVQLSDYDTYYKTKINIRYSFIDANDPDRTRDTVYMTVITTGYPLDHPRRIAFRQITEYSPEIILDEKGNIVDTLYHEVLDKGVPGVHYVAMDDPEILPHLYMPAGAVSVEIPVILLRDPSLQKTEMRICLELIATEDFQLGEKEHLYQTIYTADMFTRPSKWDDWTSTYYFGKYSQTKHRFMNEVMGMLINDDFFKLCSEDPAMRGYTRAKSWAALQEFNQDPVNIANGDAPMKDEDGEIITFPGME